VELDLHVTPISAPAPLREFASAPFDKKLLQEIAAAGYTQPTAIQAQAIPAVLSGFDVLALAKTGTMCNDSSVFLFRLFLLSVSAWVVSCSPNCCIMLYPVRISYYDIFVFVFVIVIVIVIVIVFFGMVWYGLV
jgi:hypothetical protein